MATKIEICNKALQKIGARAINSLNEDSKNARAVTLAYESAKLAELRDHDWSFAIARAQLAASVTTPAFGYEAAYPLPSDFVRLVDPDLSDNSADLDWQIESGSILTNDEAPLNVRYVKNVSNANEFDVLFVDVLATRIAIEICEEITQSNTKLENLSALYEKSLAKAKKANGFERRRQKAPTDPWITSREQ